MIVKAVSLFLIAMLVLGMFGKLRIPKVRAKRLADKKAKCSSCGAYRIGKGPCNCGASDS